jgi:hypothetical protein
MQATTKITKRSTMQEPPEDAEDYKGRDGKSDAFFSVKPGH